jgi:hypothetical protein
MQYFQERAKKAKCLKSPRNQFYVDGLFIPLLQEYASRDITPHPDNLDELELTNIMKSPNLVLVYSKDKLLLGIIYLPIEEKKIFTKSAFVL